MPSCFHLTGEAKKAAREEDQLELEMEFKEKDGLYPSRGNHARQHHLYTIQRIAVEKQETRETKQNPREANQHSLWILSVAIPGLYLLPPVRHNSSP